MERRSAPVARAAAAALRFVVGRVHNYSVEALRRSDFFIFAHVGCDKFGFQAVALRVGARELHEVRAYVYAGHVEAARREQRSALREYQRNRTVRAADFQNSLASLGTREVRQKYRVDVDTQAAFFVGLDEAQRAVHEAVRLHYDQSSSRTPTTCESPFSWSVTP